MSERMKRSLAFWAAVSLCLVTLATAAFAQDEPPPPRPEPPDSAAVDSLSTPPAAEAAPAPAAAEPDTAAAGASLRRARPTGRKFNPVFSLGIGSAVNHEPDSFRDDYNPSFGILLSGGVRRGVLTAVASFDYNFFLAGGTSPDDLNILMLFADLKYSPLSSAARPYVLVCGGLYRTWIVDEDYTEAVLGYGGGLGVEVEIGETRRLFLEGRYIQGQTRERTELQANTEVIPFRFGMTWEIK